MKNNSQSNLIQSSRSRSRSCTRSFSQNQHVDLGMWHPPSPLQHFQLHISPKLAPGNCYSAQCHCTSNTSEASGKNRGKKVFNKIWGFSFCWKNQVETKENGNKKDVYNLLLQIGWVFRIHPEKGTYHFSNLKKQLQVGHFFSKAPCIDGG